MKLRTGLLITTIALLTISQIAISSENLSMKNFEKNALAAVPFDLENVRLLDGPFKHAQDLNVEYLLKFEPDRLLAGFRTIAGLEPKAEQYGGWEAPDKLTGHSLGHYLSAICLTYKATGDKRFKERADYIVDELAEVQKANGNGYCMCSPRGKELFQEVKAGDIRPQSFNLNGCWAPLYTQHKILAGLRDTYRMLGNKKALQVEAGMGDWTISICDKLTHEQMQYMLSCEHGGMNEVLADLAYDTGKQKYLLMAKKFFHDAVAGEMVKGKDALPGIHANTQIPKFIGLARIYEITGDKSQKIGAEFFWNRVVNHHSYTTGGNCFNEYFGQPDSLNDRLGDNTTETCNVYNMLKLTSKLFCWKPRANVGDFYERALYNHILASQHPKDARVIYNLTLKMGGKKAYQDPMWFTCCCGTGMENHSKYGDSIYFHNDTDLYVNLFIASTLDWKQKELKITQQTNYPENGKTKLSFECQKPTKLDVYIRYPYWAKKGASVKINGKDIKITSTADSFIKLSKQWNSGDTVDIDFPMSLRLEPMPDNDKRVSIMYGPTVLAGELGSENDPKSKDPFYVPVLLPNNRPIDQWVKPTDKPLHFMLEKAGQPRDVELYPFYNMHEKHYTMYWDVFSNAEWKAKETQYENEKKQLLALEARTIDFVHPGEQQPELDHNLKHVNSREINGANDQKARSANQGGWFSYDMKITNSEPISLFITCWGSDRANEINIYIDGRLIAEQKLENREPNKFFNVEYKLPEDLLAGKEKINVKFTPGQGRRSTSIYGVRIAKQK